MVLLTDEDRAKGLVPSPVDAVIERVKALASENAHLRVLLAEALLECGAKPDLVERIRIALHHRPPR
jgi:ABC-type branched-subunit amino acid transport system ATPase component